MASAIRFRELVQSKATALAASQPMMHDEVSERHQVSLDLMRQIRKADYLTGKKYSDKNQLNQYNNQQPQGG